MSVGWRFEEPVQLSPASGPQARGAELMKAVHTAGQALTGSSCLYECRVMHHRLSPKRHRFEYGIFMALLDLDELDALTARLRFFGRNRSRPYNFQDDDHLQTRNAECGARNEAPTASCEISNLK